MIGRKMYMDKLSVFLLRMSGFLVLLIGVAHFAMPSFGYTVDALTEIPEVQREHFVYLGTYAIGTFLVAFGILTLICDPISHSFMERTFVGLMAIVWSLRLVLELIFPVNLSLFFLSAPHLPLLFVLSLILLGYFAGLARIVVGTALPKANN